MDGASSPAEEQALVTSFLEIAAGQSPGTARQFLQATNWNLEEAIQLFYVGNDAGAAVVSSPPRQLQSDIPSPNPVFSGPVNDIEDENAQGGDVSDVRPPLPVKRDVLYDNAMFYGGLRMGGSSQAARPVVPFRNFEEEMRRPGVWEAENGSAPVIDSSRDNLASLYRPPFGLMFHGPFEKAKDTANSQNKWLLVNLQSTTEFSSHMLNRDTWANETVAHTIKNNFIFWQVYDDTEEGRKVCTYYKLESIPVVMLVDPVTGQKMRSWRGMVQPETLLEDLLPYMDDSPKDHFANMSHKRPRESSKVPQRVKDENEDQELLRALAVSMEGVEDVGNHDEKDADIDEKTEICPAKTPTYPSLPEEPKPDRIRVCKVGVRLPDGRRIQRNFFLSDPIQVQA
ncbi:OLC1v1033064C5 [Oldenlandia corymbosa var. corymbosa]|uniref:OLC1v1033064C5 n=1 Tax=Oldenlandia corymbosa var. corymbosa TaxID=529605 RepID=A0AAV1CMP3_OLDCO|nr:OLC1v1033064C5 [Oldenlandia corymbosa var. corymbosa]